MRVCVISPGVVHAYSRTAAFAAYFDEVHYIDLVNNDVRLEKICDNVKVYTPKTYEKKRLVGKDISRLLRQIRPDGIVCHFAAGVHLVQSVLYNRCPVAAIGMGQDILYDKGDRYISWIQRLLIRMTIRRADFISAKSEFLAQRLKEYGYNNTLDINYWGASAASFKRVDRETARNHIGVDNARPVILSPRAVEPRLNIDVIVRSMQGILKHYPDALLVILGRESAEYKKTIVELIRQGGLENNVLLLGMVKQEQLLYYYSAADVVVSAARSEGFPNTLLEVMACEIPIVAGDIPQIRELLVDGVNATLCQINEKSLAKAVTEVLDHPDSARDMVAKSFNTMNDVGNIEKNGYRFYDVFSDVIKEHDNYKRPVISILSLAFVYFFFRVYKKLNP